MSGTNAPREWLIVGGGIHGVHLAVRLLDEAGVEPRQLRIVDPAERLLARWRACTDVTGMTFLRSPAVHHIGIAPMALKGFARARASRAPARYAPPYDQPALELFNAYCDHVIDTHDLAELHIRDRAVRLAVDCDRVQVSLASGRTLESRQLVLALGASEQPCWPDWAPRNHERVQHVFAPGFDGWPKARETVVVIGGGISASQVALRLASEGHTAHLIAPHGVRMHQFDSDPGWLGPKHMAGFDRETDPDRRRALITEARHKGSVPPDVQRALRRALAREEITWHEGTVESFDATGDRLALRLGSGATLMADRVLLGTGFDARRPGGAMVDDLVRSASLPCAACGYPIVDGALRWHPRVHVSGPLAELELGPVARNIAGAMRAGERLVEAVRSNRAAPAAAG